MKKTEAFLLLAILLIPFIVYSQEASTGVGLTIGEYDSDNDGTADSSDTDDDNDGLTDANDTLVGNSSFVQSDTVTVNVTVNNSINLTQNFSQTFEVVIKDTNTTLVNFSFDFSEKTLNLANVTIQRETVDGKGSTLVRGVTLTSGQKKTMYVDNKNTSTDNLCVKDKHIDKISDISSSCTGTSETVITCDGTTKSGYTCTKVEDNTRYKVTGLSFSGIIETSASPIVESGATTTTTGGGGGGGDGGRGGGGSGLIIVKREFTLSKEALKVILKQGQIKEETFTIKNTGDVTLAIEIDPKNLENFVTFQDIDIGNLVLLPGQEQTITSVFKAYEDQKPDIYPGEIIFNGQSVEKKIPTVVEVDSASPLFDADVQVLPQYKSVLPGNSILIEVSLFNVRGFGRVDVNLEYSISDFRGNMIATEHETVAVETQAKFSRELPIPADTGPGTYIASVKVTFENSVGISSDVFEVKAKAIRLIPVPIRDLAPYLAGIVVVALIVYMFIARGTGLRGKKHAPKTKDDESELLKTEQKIKKLEKELAASESAYKSGFISEESYRTNKERVEKELDKLRKE